MMRAMLFSFTIAGFEVTGLTLFGFLGQFIFFLRVMVQWIASEKEGKSIVPIMYWHLSILGSFLVLIYAFMIKDIVFFIGQFLAMLIYARNIHLYPKQVDRTETT